MRPLKKSRKFCHHRQEFWDLWNNYYGSGTSAACCFTRNYTSNPCRFIVYTPESNIFKGKKEKYIKSKNQGRGEEFFTQYAQKILANAIQSKLSKEPSSEKTDLIKFHKKKGKKRPRAHRSTQQISR